MMAENNGSENNTDEAFAYTPGLKVKRSMTVSKERRLPLLGDILVEKGDSVSYDKIVAKTEVPGDPELVKVSAILGIDHNEVPDFISKKEGDKLQKGEVFGSYKAFFGLINRKVTSPLDGEIESVSKLTGQVIIRPEPVPVDVNAYIPGKVVEILPREGVVIATQAAFIQGILGLGGEAHGEIRIVVDSPEDELTAETISEEDKGRILIGGSLITLEGFKRAVEIGVAGLVAGGMNYKDVTEIMGKAIGVAITGHEELGTTLIITEGFGKMTMSTRAPPRSGRGSSAPRSSSLTTRRRNLRRRSSRRVWSQVPQ
jgi:hypothetical protein